MKIKKNIKSYIVAKNVNHNGKKFQFEIWLSRYYSNAYENIIF